ncbi:MAG: DUF2163 domain-containing protein [Nitrospiraceae bacterium]
MKSASTELDTHLQEEVTSLTMCWKVKRVDGTLFHFTEHDVDIPIDADGEGVATYSASSSYNRSAIVNDDSLAVDNLDLTGVLDSLEIDETELRRGLFDFAEILVFVVNWKDLSQGILKMRKGWLGEVTITPNGFFQAELRGLTQALSRTIGDLYSPECRVDLGDSLCKIPIFPEVAVRNKVYALGDFVRATSDLEPVVLSVFTMTANVDLDDISDNAAVATIGPLAARNIVTTKFGAGSIEFTPESGPPPDRNPSDSFVTWPDLAAYSLGSNDFTIELFVRFKDLTQPNQTMLAHYDNDAQRAFSIRAIGADIVVFFSDDGSSAPPAITMQGTVTWVIDTWFHVAVSREGNDFRVYVDGVQIVTTTSSISIKNSTAPLFAGKLSASIGGFDEQALDGFVDEIRIVNGLAVYTGASSFTPPTVGFATRASVLAAALCADFDDRIYVVTTAGTSDSFVQPAYDTVVGNTTTDGDVVFTAEEAWSRCITVLAVDPTNLRKNFTVTELTPNSGAGTPGRSNFPADSMDGGVVVWETGNNAGTAMEIRNFVADDGITIEQDINLFLDLHFDIVIGDTARVYRGCFKRSIEDCKDVFDNIVNFRGEPFVPGQDHLTLTPNAR